MSFAFIFQSCALLLDSYAFSSEKEKTGSTAAALFAVVVTVQCLF